MLPTGTHNITSETKTTPQEQYKARPKHLNISAVALESSHNQPEASITDSITVNHHHRHRHHHRHPRQHFDRHTHTNSHVLCLATALMARVGMMLAMVATRAHTPFFYNGIAIMTSIVLLATEIWCIGHRQARAHSTLSNTPETTSDFYPSYSRHLASRLKPYPKQA